MPGKEHFAMTEAAVKAIPPEQRKLIGEAGEESLISSSSLPDRYFDLEGCGYREALPYMFFTDGIQFHYLPNSPIEPEYKYWSVVCDKKGNPRRLRKPVRCENLNWKHAFRGFSYYLEKMSRAAKAQDFEAFGGFGGVLLHVLQDACTGLHALEGVDGVDIFALDRLVEPPGGDPFLSASSVLSSKKHGQISPRSPRLLGECPAEAAFRLYSAYSQTVSGARHKLMPLLMSVYEKDLKQAEFLYTAMLSEAAGLCADVLYTTLCTGTGKFLKNEKKKLGKVYLSDMKPVREPRGLSQPYRFTTMLKNASLGPQGPAPLKLKDEKGRIRNFKKGLGTGCHFEYSIAYYLPPGVYSTFSCFCGLHSELGKGGDIRVQIKFRGKNMFSGKFNDRRPSKKVEFTVKKGGLLEFNVKSDKGMNGRENNIVWGEPVLIKD